MTIKEIKKELEKHNLDIDEFIGWINGQTGYIKDNKLHWYSHDMERYIDLKTKGIPTYFD